MGVEILWILSTASNQDLRRGEWAPRDRPWSPQVDANSRARGISHYDYLAQLARAVMLTGFDGLLIPDDPTCEEPWMVAGALLRGTPKLKFVAATVPGATSAVYAVKMAASFQRFSRGRLALAIDLGGDEVVRRRAGDFAAEAEVYSRAEEFLTIAHGLWASDDFTFHGKAFLVEKGGVRSIVRELPRPEVYMSGHSEMEFALSAKFGDVHLFDFDTVEVLRKRAGRLRMFNRTDDRPQRVGVNISILARESDEEAEADARRLKGRATPDLVGSYETVTARIGEFVDVGFTSLALTAVSQLEEAYRLGEQVVARLRAREISGPSIVA